jgi:hypothetical protein
VTVTVYVLVVVVSCAVTTTAIAVLPTLRACALDALPDVTALPPTFNVAEASLLTGVTSTLVIVFALLAMYDVTLALNAGMRLAEPVPRTSEESVASVFCATDRVTAIVYVFVVLASWAVTCTVIELTPTESARLEEVAPEVSDSPSTVRVACAPAAVGITLTAVMLLDSTLVYDTTLGENVGTNVPMLRTREPKSASLFLSKKHTANPSVVLNPEVANHVILSVIPARMAPECAVSALAEATALEAQGKLLLRVSSTRDSHLWFVMEPEYTSFCFAAAWYAAWVLVPGN